jgi:hypothetical protein
MPTCKLCSSNFPYRIVIEGKERILSSRKYCLECSPFNSHNTKNLLKTKSDTNIKYLKCNTCFKEWKYIRGKGGTIKQCRSCVTKHRRTKGREKAHTYKGKCCLMCSYDRCKDSLHFHHIDQEEKSFQISRHMNRTWEILKSELDKCVLICANCHGEVHSGLITKDILISKENQRIKCMPS